MPISNQAIYQKIATIKNECTRKTYETRLQNLGNALSADLYDIFKHPSKYIPKIKEVYKPVCTQRNIATAVLAAFNMFSELKSKKANAYSEWTSYQKALREQYSPIAVSHNEEIADAYKRVLIDIPSKKPRASMKALLLSLAVHAPWAIKHAGTMAIVYPPATRSPSEEYVYMCPNKPFIATQKKRTAMPRQLYADISASVGTHPRTFLFVGSDKGPFRKQNSYGVFVKRTMQAATGKPLGINDIGC